MDESKYEWQTLHKTKADAFKALATHREHAEWKLQFPNVPGDLDKDVENMENDVNWGEALNENTRAKLHVSSLPDGPIDLNPQANKLYLDEKSNPLDPVAQLTEELELPLIDFEDDDYEVGEKSNPLDPVAQLTEDFKKIPSPSEFGVSVKNLEQQGEGLGFINNIREVGSLLRVFALPAGLDANARGRLGNTLPKILENDNCKTNWRGKYNSELSELICPSALRLNKYYMEGHFHDLHKAEIIKAGKMFIFASYAATRNPKVEAVVQELLDMTKTMIDLEIRQWQSNMPSVPSTTNTGGKRKTRKYKKRRVKKSKTRKGKKSRKHKSKTHKKRKHRRGRKSRKH